MSLFTEPERALWGAFLRAYATLDRAVEGDLRAREGIRHAEFEVLLRLRLAPGGRARIQDLATASVLTRSGISRVVDRLSRAGLVERTGASEDGRGTYAVITADGAALFDSLADRHVAVVRRHFHDRLTAEEKRVMTRALAKLGTPVTLSGDPPDH